MAANQVKRIVDVPAAGTFLRVFLSGPTCYARLVESPLTSTGTANTVQGGFLYRLKNDGTTNGFTTVFEASPTPNNDNARLELGDPQGTTHYRSPLGSGPQDALGAGAGTTPGTIMCDLSGIAGATSVEITEDF